MILSLVYRLRVMQAYADRSVCLTALLGEVPRSHASRIPQGSNHISAIMACQARRAISTQINAINDQPLVGAYAIRPHCLSMKSMVSIAGVWHTPLRRWASLWSVQL